MAKLKNYQIIKLGIFNIISIYTIDIRNTDSNNLIIFGLINDFDKFFRVQLCLIITKFKYFGIFILLKFNKFQLKETNGRKIHI